MATIARDWITEAGLRAVCLRVTLDHVPLPAQMNTEWLCGYVEVPVGHPLHGKPYNAEASPELAFDVHGGLTFSAAGREDGLG